MILMKKFDRIAFYLISFLLISGIAHAHVYFYFDAEDETAGYILPLYEGSDTNFCQIECNGGGTRGVIASNGAPQGEKYFYWETVDNQVEHYTQVKSDAASSNGWPITLTMGHTYYLAFYARFDRLKEMDIWHEGKATQSADKGVEVYGPNIGISVSRGQWDHMAANKDHQYTTYTSIIKGDNSTTTFGHNQNGYSANTPYQQDYEKWYAIVLGFSLSDSGTGTTRLWINGKLVEKITGLNTVEASGSTVIDSIKMGGALAEPGYDAPAHYRKFDALMLTDSWQDITRTGYLAYGHNNSNVKTYAGRGAFSPAVMNAKLYSTRKRYMNSFSNPLSGYPWGGFNLDGVLSGDKIITGGQDDTRSSSF